MAHFSKPNNFITYGNNLIKIIAVNTADHINGRHPPCDLSTPLGVFTPLTSD